MLAKCRYSLILRRSYLCLWDFFGCWFTFRNWSLGSRMASVIVSSRLLIVTTFFSVGTAKPADSLFPLLPGQHHLFYLVRHFPNHLTVPTRQMLNFSRLRLLPTPIE